jgi:phospholipase/carboxylesterase
MTRSIIDTTADHKTDLSLTYLVREPIQASNKARAIILLHGVGSNEEDLFGLASQLPADMYIISPGGPFILGPGRYAWYNVDFSTGRPIIQSAQEAASREKILSFIREVKEKYLIDELYLGGFSQGAIMSYSIGLTHPGAVRGIISFSGRILDEVRPLVQNDNYLQQLKVLVAHGVLDNTLPIHYAREAKVYLESLGVQLTYHEYPIGHQLSNEVLPDLNNWLG